jgi:ribosome-binding factor A
MIIGRRIERINALLRNTIGQLLLAKISDPRIDPARTSVTHVVTADDLLSAKVYISVIGTAGQQNRTLSALKHASGHIQELVADKVELRNMPILTFALDTQFKKTMETLTIIQKVSEEIRQKELAAGQDQGPEGSQDQPAPDQPVQADEDDDQDDQHGA